MVLELLVQLVGVFLLLLPCLRRVVLSEAAFVQVVALVVPAVAVLEVLESVVLVMEGLQLVAQVMEALQLVAQVMEALQSVDQVMEALQSVARARSRKTAWLGSRHKLPPNSWICMRQIPELFCNVRSR